MNTSKTLGLSALAIALPLSIGTAQATALLPGSQSVSFEQLDFRSVFLNSSIAEVSIDLANARSAAGISQGYINIADASGNWVVRNLPVFDSASFGYGSISTSFDLGTANGSNVTSVLASVDFSAAPSLSFGGAPQAAFTVTDAGFAVGGFGATAAPRYLAAPTPQAVNFTAGFLTRSVIQNGHLNLQAANNQCAPMAVANSLQWLKTSQGVAVPDTHKVGLKGDDSLVGKLDGTMNRDVTSRALGSGLDALPILSGKLDYLKTANLGSLIVKHQGLLGGGDVTSSGLSSKGMGTAIDPQFIFDELQHGEDVELGYIGDGVAHFVDVIAAGFTLGVPWIKYVSDHLQTDVDPTDTKGTGKVDFSYIVGGKLVDEKDAPNIAFIITQSVPEPAEYLMLLLGLPLMARKIRADRVQRSAGL